MEEISRTPYDLNQLETIWMDTLKYHEAKIKHTRISIIPRVGHMSFWEDTERFNSDIRSFVNSL
jgi:pimeloyl-ACP methyl ester carboxylesterase